MVDVPKAGAVWWALGVIERAEDNPGLEPGDVTEVRALAWEAVALTGSGQDTRLKLMQP